VRGVVVQIGVSIDWRWIVTSRDSHGRSGCGW
jgi:hypothetical protein